MPDPTDKRIEELRQYIPPYTAPNYPPQVKVITSTNTGDTPMNEEDPDLLADDGDHDQSRSRSPFPAMSERFRLSEELANAKYQNNLLVQKCRELEKERDEARREVCGYSYDDPRGVARDRGWDCFKE